MYIHIATHKKTGVCEMSYIYSDPTMDNTYGDIEVSNFPMRDRGDEQREYLHDIFLILHEAWIKIDEARERASDAGDTDLAWEIVKARFTLTDLSGDVFYRIYPREEVTA